MFLWQKAMTGRLLRYARNDVSRNKATIGLSVIASGVQRSAANQINKLPFWIASYLAMTRSERGGEALSVLRFAFVSLCARTAALRHCEEARRSNPGVMHT